MNANYNRRFRAPEAPERRECSCGEPVVEGQDNCPACEAHFEKQRKLAARNRARMAKQTMRRAI